MQMTKNEPTIDIETAVYRYGRRRGLTPDEAERMSMTAVVVLKAQVERTLDQAGR
jgi:hypothetical protein